MNQPVSSLLSTRISGPWQLWGSTTLSLWVYLDLKKHLPGVRTKTEGLQEKWLHTMAWVVGWDLAFVLVWKSHIFFEQKLSMFPKRHVV